MAFSFEKVKENIQKASTEGLLNNPRREDFVQIAKEALERYLSKARWRWVYQDEILKQRSLDRLANILILADGDVEGWRVLDLGCGSPDEGWPPYHHTGWLPYKAEVLSDLGARVVGVDYRPNPSASYEHRVVDFGEFCDHNYYGDCLDPNPNPKRYQSLNKDKKELAKKRLEGDFDLVIATSLVNDGLTNDDYGYDTLTYLLGVCANPHQIQYFDSFRRISGELRRYYIWNLKRHGIEILADRGDSIGIKE